MIRVRVEIVPFGIEAGAREIACAEIGNVGGTKEIADYCYRIADNNSVPGEERGEIRWRKRGLIRGFERRRLVWALIYEVLKSAKMGAKCQRK